MSNQHEMSAKNRRFAQQMSNRNVVNNFNFMIRFLLAIAIGDVFSFGALVILMNQFRANVIYPFPHNFQISVVDTTLASDSKRGCHESSRDTKHSFSSWLS